MLARPIATIMPSMSRAPQPMARIRQISSAKRASSTTLPMKPSSSADDGEDEVGRLHRQEAQLVLPAGGQPLPEQAAGADRVQRLDELVARTLRIGVRVQEAEEPRPLVVLQRLTAIGAAADRRAGQDRHPADARPAHEQHSDQDRHEDQGRARGPAAGRRGRWGSPSAARRRRSSTGGRSLAAAGQEAGQHHDHQHLADLAELEVQPGHGDRHLGAEQVGADEHRERQQPEHRRRRSARSRSAASGSRCWRRRRR